MRGFKVRDFRNKGFFVLDDAYLNGFAKLLDPTTTVVYLSLCRHADKEQTSFPSQKLIAEEHNIHPQTVKRKIKKLVTLNIIRIEKIKSKDGKWLNNTYYLVDKSEWADPRGIQSTSRSPGVSKIQTRGTQDSLKDTHKKDTHTLYRKNDLKNISDREIETIAQRYQVPIAFVKSKQDDLINYVERTGKTYKNYLAALRNFVKQDAIKLRKEAGGSKRAIDASGL